MNPLSLTYTGADQVYTNLCC